MMVIRPGQLRDLPDMALLWVDMVKEQIPTATPNREWWLKYYHDIMSSSVYRSLVAEIDGAIVGFIDGIIYPDPITGQLIGQGHHFYVMPEVRGAVGSRLYRRFIIIAMALGLSVLEFICLPGKHRFWEEKNFRVSKIHMRRSLW